MYVHTHTHSLTDICTHSCVSVNLSVYVYGCMHMYPYVDIDMYIRMCRQCSLPSVGCGRCRSSTIWSTLHSVVPPSSLRVEAARGGRADVVSHVASPTFPGTLSVGNRTRCGWKGRCFCGCQLCDSFSEFITVACLGRNKGPTVVCTRWTPKTAQVGNERDVCISR